VPVQFFYDEMAGPAMAAADSGVGGTGDRVMDLVTSSEGLQLNQAFVEIRSAEVRRRIIDLVRAIAAG
jgi:hypothetical protein